MAEVNANDTAGAPPQVQSPAPMEIEVVDTVAASPEANAVPSPQSAPIFGKYKSLDEAEHGYKEVERAMHEKAQEAATYRRMLDERQAQPVTPQYAPAPVPDFDEKFREQLADRPGDTIMSLVDFIVNKKLEQQTASQREVVRKYQTYASNPDYAPIAQEVAAQLPFANEPIDPIEGAFLRAQIAHLKAQMQGRAAAPANPVFAEPSRGMSRPGSSLRVELDPDTARMRGMGDAKVRELASIVARQKSNGGNMNVMTIDDWEKAHA